MNSSIFCVILGLALVTSLSAGVRSYTLPATDLSDWQFKGVTAGDMLKQAAFALPAGAELFRDFPGGSVVLAVGSRPYFGATSADWPVLQAGPVALVLTREGEVGRIALVVDETVRMLPTEIALEASGRARDSLELVLGFDPAKKLGVVGLGGQVISMRGNASVATVQVALSAGTDKAWAQDWVEVLVLSPDEAETASENWSAESDSKTSGSASLLQAAANRLWEGQAFGSGPDGEGGKVASNVAAESLRPTLEVYTPPAVRTGADNVRAILAASQKK